MDEIGADPERFPCDIALAFHESGLTQAIGLDERRSPVMVRFHRFGFHKAATAVIRADLSHDCSENKAEIRKKKFSGNAKMTGRK